MKDFSLKKSILFSYKMFFSMVVRTYFQSWNTQARLTPKRFIIMSLFFPTLFLLNTIHWIGFLMDEFFFPDYRKIELKAPLFIVGIPRSGTSYMHRLIAKDTDRFTTLKLWELLLAPSISERKLWGWLGRVDNACGGPVSGIIRQMEGRATVGLDNIHQIRFNDPEEDYFLLTPLFACYLMILPFPFMDLMGHLAYFDDRTPEMDKQLIMGFYKTCLQRHLYTQKPEKQLLSKNVAFAPMVRALTDTFPDCRIICNVRNPLKSIPSHISSMMAGLAVFDNDPRGYEFRDQMIDLQRYAFSHVSDFLPTLPRHQHVFIRMEDLKSDVHREITRVYKRFDWDMAESFEKDLELEKKKERHYTSGHTYSLALFGLTAEEVSRRFVDVFNKFDYESEEGSTRQYNSQSA